MLGALDQTQVQAFHDEGYLGPFDLCSAQQMHAYRQHIDQILYQTMREAPAKPVNKSRHLDDPVVYELCSHRALVDKVTSILGPDVLLWQSNFFNKEVGTAAYPWHQDAHYWSGVIEPQLSVSAWLAIDNAAEYNGCVQLIPGSHKRTYRHVDTADFAGSFRQQADPEEIALQKQSPVSMELEAGQFFLFSERMLHRSAANVSNDRRLGLAIRLTSPIVRVNKNHPVLLVHGEDRMGFNAIGSPPTTGLGVS